MREVTGGMYTVPGRKGVTRDGRAFDFTNTYKNVIMPEVYRAAYTEKDEYGDDVYELRSPEEVAKEGPKSWALGSYRNKEIFQFLMHIAFVAPRVTVPTSSKPRRIALGPKEHTILNNAETLMLNNPSQFKKFPKAWRGWEGHMIAESHLNVYLGLRLARMYFPELKEVRPVNWVWAFSNPANGDASDDNDNEVSLTDWVKDPVKALKKAKATRLAKEADDRRQKEEEEEDDRRAKKAAAAETLRRAREEALRKKQDEEDRKAASRKSSSSHPSKKGPAMAETWPRTKEQGASQQKAPPGLQPTNQPNVFWDPKAGVYWHAREKFFIDKTFKLYSYPKSGSWKPYNPSNFCKRANSGSCTTKHAPSIKPLSELSAEEEAKLRSVEKTLPEPPTAPEVDKQEKQAGSEPNMSNKPKAPTGPASVNDAPKAHTKGKSGPMAPVHAPAPPVAGARRRRR